MNRRAYGTEGKVAETVAQRHTLTALKFASFASTLSWITWVPRLPEIKDHLGLSFDQLGLILMVSGLTMAVSASPTAALIHHFKSKRVTLVGALVSVLGNLIIGLANSGITLTIGLIVAAFGIGLLNTANNTQINTLSAITGENERNKLSAFAPLGSMASLILGTALLTVLSTVQYLMSIQAFAVLTAIGVYPYLFNEDIGAAEKGTKQVKMPWFGKRMAAFWLALAALYATTLAEFSVGDWAGILARDNFHINAPWYLLVILAFQLGLFVSRAASTRLINRFGEVNVVRFATVGSAIVWGIVIFTAGQVGQSSPAAALAWAGFGFFIAGCGIGPNWGVLLAAATIPGFPAPVTLSRIFGLLSLVFSFGPGLVGLLAKTVGLTNAMLLPVLCLGVVGFLVPTIIHNDRQARAADLG